MDYGKYRYKLEISEKIRKKKQSQIIVKEIKLRPKIDTNDLNTKKKQITVMFRGREIVHKELGMNILDRLVKELEEKSVLELEPKLDGYNIIMILAPD